MTTRHQHAFQNGELKEEVFMSQTLDFEISQPPTLVCKLHKALYGLIQAHELGLTTFTCPPFGFVFAKSINLSL